MSSPDRFAVPVQRSRRFQISRASPNPAAAGQSPKSNGRNLLSSRKSRVVLAEAIALGRPLFRRYRHRPPGNVRAGRHFDMCDLQSD
jgi:hypothetical protein